MLAVSVILLLITVTNGNVFSDVLGPEIPAKEEHMCQEPGNAICYFALFNIHVGDPCCAETACLPYPFGDPVEENNFCQKLGRIPPGGECGNKVGICAHAYTCDFTAENPTCIPESGCALTNGVCFSLTEHERSCCLPSDACFPDPHQIHTFTCQKDCADAGEECYTPTVMKNCCDSEHACLYDANATTYRCGALTSTTTA